MKSGTKTAVSLLIAFVIFACLFVASSFGVFSHFERRFYEPTRLALIQQKLNAVADFSNDYIASILVKIKPETDGFLGNTSVQSFLESTPTDEAIRAFEELRENISALDGFRLVDSSGRRVHFSSYRNDYSVKDGRRIYSDYKNLHTIRGNDELSFEKVAPVDGEKVIFDGKEHRIIFAFPYKLNEEQNFCAIFYINPLSLTDLLAEKRLISVTESVSLVSSEDASSGGFVFGLPKVSRSLFAPEILNIWKELKTEDSEKINLLPREILRSGKKDFSGITVESDGETKIEENDEIENNWFFIPAKNNRYINVGGVYTGQNLEMPVYVRYLLLLCAFLTVSLVLICIFNIKKDDDVIIRSKIKQIQIGILNDYFEQELDKKQLASLLESQKDDLSKKIKKSLGRRGKKYEKELEGILNKSWKDIITILSGETEKSSEKSGFSKSDMQEIRAMFEEIVSKTAIKVQNVSVDPIPPVKKTENVLSAQDEVEELEDVEELSEIEEAEPAEEIDEVEEAEPVEELGEVEELDEVESVESVEEISPAEEISKIEEAEPVEELEEVEPVEELDEVEEIDELEFLDEENDSSNTNENNESLSLDGYDEEFDLKDNSVVFTPSGNVDRAFFEGSEPLEIGDNTLKDQNTENKKSSAADNFVIYKPLDYIFEEKTEKSEEHISETVLDEVQKEDSYAQLEELPKNKEGFMFTTFASTEGIVTELIPDAIVLGEDGVFHISEDIAESELPLDEEFKKLVDSVIK